MTSVIALRYLCSLIAIACSLLILMAPIEAAPIDTKKRFLKRHCYECHRGEDAEGSLDLSALSLDLTDKQTHKKWVRIFDRVAHGEMPPKEADQPSQMEVRAFKRTSAQWLHEYEQAKYKAKGRVVARRLTSLQIERSLQQVLGIDIPLAHHFPDTSNQRFETISAGQVMSPYFTQKLLQVIDLSLDHAFHRALTNEKQFEKYFNAQTLSRDKKKRNTREPEFRQGLATTWLSNLPFYGRLPATEAKEGGWVRTTIKVKALNPVNGGMWAMIRSGYLDERSSVVEWVGYIQTKGQFKTWTFDHYLPKGHMIEIKPVDKSIRKFSVWGINQTGTGDKHKVPGIGVEWVKMKRIFKQQDQTGLRHILFGDLTFERHQREQPIYHTRRNNNTGKIIKRKTGSETIVTYTLKPRNVRQDLRRLMLAFAKRAYRRPTAASEITPYVSIAESLLAQGGTLTDALKLGYRSILCSPRFLYFYEQPGKLDDYAMASRLSYMIWQAPPDETLLSLAAQKKLQTKAVLLAQLDRMLKDPRGKNFIKDLTHDWLDLKDINFTKPENYLAPTFDPVVQQSMLDETHAFLQHLLNEDQSVTHLIDTNYTFLNNRLARYYQIQGVNSEKMRRVTLPKNSPRGGLLGHGSILKITANGTNTSPVIRGIWVIENILGLHVPPPPNVPAAEPDIRGVTSIRDILAKHREVESCASCHRVIDPPGFALENFDPAGQWRLKYKFGPGKLSRYKIDPSYTLSDGRAFKDLQGFKSLVSQNSKQLARNVLDQFIAFGTGATVGFHDRPVVEQMILSTNSTNHGFKSLLKEVITSRLFTHK